MDTQKLAIFEIHTQIIDKIQQQIIYSCQQEDKGDNKNLVEHFSFDLRMSRIFTKLNQMRNHEKITGSFNDFDLAILIEQINKKYSNDIESYTSLMSIIDHQWKKTWWFFFWQIIFFVGFVVIPFVL